MITRKIGSERVSCEGSFSQLSKLIVQQLALLAVMEMVQGKVGAKTVLSKRIFGLWLLVSFHSYLTYIPETPQTKP